MSGDPKENLMLFKVWVDFNPKQPDDKQVSMFCSPPPPSLAIPTMLEILGGEGRKLECVGGQDAVKGLWCLVITSW